MKRTVTAASTATVLPLAWVVLLTIPDLVGAAAAFVLAPALGCLAAVLAGTTGKVGKAAKVTLLLVLAAMIAWWHPLLPFQPPKGLWLWPAGAWSVAWVALWISWFKPTVKSPKERPKRPARKGTPSGPFVMQVGRYVERRKAFRLDLSAGRHTLIAGATGSGKGGVLWSIIRGLTQLIERDMVRLVLIDPKGGMELSAAQPFAAEWEWGDDDDAEERIAALLEREAARVRDKAAECRSRGIRKHKATPGDPMTVIVIDELLAVVDEIADVKLRTRIENALKRILRQGRAPGWIVLACTQDPSKEALGATIARGFPVRVCLRVTDANQVAMVLGNGIRKNHNAEADKIPIDKPGRAYVWDEEAQTAALVQFDHVTDADVQALADNYIANRDTDHTLEPFTGDTATGEDEAVEEVDPFLRRLITVWPEDRKRDPGNVHLSDLATLLSLPAYAVEEELARVGIAVTRAVSAKPVNGKPGSTSTSKKGVKWSHVTGSAFATHVATAD